MDSRVVREASRVTVQLQGDLVALTVPALREQLRQHVQEGVTELVLDLKDTRMVDSSGIGLLMAAYNSIRRAGGSLTVIHAVDEIRELFVSMRLNQHLTISDD